MSYINIQGQESPFVFRYALDLLTYRHLTWNLVGADLRARFRRSYLGILWAVLQPLIFSLIVGYVWGTIFHYPSVWDYALYVFSGMIVWDYFATVVTVSQDSLLAAEGYLRQTRIPFFVFQVRTALTGMVVLCFGAVGLLGMMMVMGKLPTPGLHLLMIPLYFPVLFAFMTPITIIMSILGTQLRDLKYISMLMVQALFFVSPVMLAPKVLNGEQMRWINIVNPMAELLQMFRQPLLESSYWTMQQGLTVAAWTGAFWAAALILASANGRRLIFSL